MTQTDPLSHFHLKPIRAARVSEISEATAAAPVPSEERINFHIGNPLQDARHASAFLRVALGIDVSRVDVNVADPDGIMEVLGWDPSDKPKLELFIRLIEKSSPYMPRGGYLRGKPHALIKAFCYWLEHQQDPLHYDTGEQSAIREMIIGSGGIDEMLRIILFVISSYLVITPARILCYRQELLPHLKAIPGLLFEDLSTDEDEAIDQVEHTLVNQPEVPTFLIIGDLLKEESRRRLRRLSIKLPLFFIEANDAPNHLSLAREAKLIQRVIRLLTPAIFGSRLHTLSTVFIAGNADFLKVIENVHFQLKGTPSASEIEFLIYILEQMPAYLQEDTPVDIPQIRPATDGRAFGMAAESALTKMVERTEGMLDRILEHRAQTMTRSLERIEEQTAALDGHIWNPLKVGVFDELSTIESNDLLDLLVQNLNNPSWCQTLERSFLSNFIKHQPQYRLEDCLVTSGSSRTALGILGFYCGITEAVIPDLSWSYEQCFPKVHAVPLTESLELDVDAIIARIEELCQEDETWQKRGAVVISNPHNATGRVFDESGIRRLITYCLQRNLNMIDDLAYQNLAPLDSLPEIKTARQITAELVRIGEVDEAQATHLTTVHSISKIDCLAGARLAVLEIRDQGLRQKFEALNVHIQPNLAAILLGYLFYRGPEEATRTCWYLRNSIFRERTQALMNAVTHLPADRNPFGLAIIPPVGSMYPLLHIERLPAGLSLDWLASSLARRGVGLLPLATFARTEKGFETGRTTFRLTLGGVDGAEILLAKTRRLLIDLNRLIAEEEARYNRKRLPLHFQKSRSSRALALSRSWDTVVEQVLQICKTDSSLHRLMAMPPLDDQNLQTDFSQYYLPERLDLFRTRLMERAQISDDLMRKAMDDNGGWLAERLEREVFKDSIQRRRDQFRMRLYDRTVHPTQMYSIQAEMALDGVVEVLISNQTPPRELIKKAARELVQEYLGRNVSISSQDEADEILLDLATLTAIEDYAELYTAPSHTTFLSFWSDWDGSNRPSGQGHRLVATIVMENVRRMTHILDLLRRADTSIPLSPQLLTEMEQLPEQNKRFTKLLNNITLLTDQLEQRYRGILPFSVETSGWQRFTTRIKLRRDPVKVLWEHNDRYEQKMLELRGQRREMLDYYFSLNKQLRKQLYALIPAFQQNRASEPLLRELVGYHDILQRTVITPRIHQGMITARDQFAIDTTIFNMHEINTIAGKYGNPGATLAMQVSLSTRPEALIALDRKMRTQGEQMHRDYAVELPSIWLIPLFEDIDTIKNMRVYLDRMWEYATQSRQTTESPQDRFAEIISEIFVAGSDLSQQVSQATGAFLYRKGKFEIQSWLAEHGVAEAVRIKLGSGEPMQRQGGYYAYVAGRPAVLVGEDTRRRYLKELPAAARKSTAYAVTPLQGVFLGGDLRTFQSNLSEKLRFLPVADFASLLYHVRESQRIHRNDLLRAAEMITESRLGAQNWSVKELERLTVGMSEAVYESFLEELTDNFRHILYGREEDVIGIHIVSYFIGRSLPQLRDRPTSRRISGTGAERGQQILANIAEIIPLSQQGSLLRAIAHNQSQTVVLGVNQLSTGLFRALERFAQKTFAEAERERMIAERLLPHLPVYEILNTLRIYQDWQGEFLKQIETAFPAGNSAFVAQREDSDAMKRYLPLFQKELLRRHGVNVNDFFTNGIFIQDLLPTLRADLAVLLQADLFNTDIDFLLGGISGKVNQDWREQVTKLLQTSGQIHIWRSIIWDIMGESIYQRVQSFAELAVALYSFSTTYSFGASPAVAGGAKLSPALTSYLRTARADDEMRNFLIGTLEYLNTIAERNIEVPISIIRAMNDVERIAQIEETALPVEKQEVIRNCVLQIARLTGENG